MKNFFLAILFFVTHVSLAKVYLPLKLEAPIINKDGFAHQKFEPSTPETIHTYLVQLSGEPLLKKLSNSKHFNDAERDSLLAGLRDETQKFKNSLRLIFKGKHLKFLHEYNKVWNGLAIELKQEDIPLLAKHSEIALAMPALEYRIPEVETNFQSLTELDPPEEMLPPLNIPDIWLNIVSMRHMGTERIHYAAAGFNFENLKETIQLPVDGYAHSDAKRTDYRGYVSLVDQIYIGKGDAFNRLGWQLNYYQHPPQSCLDKPDHTLEVTGNI